jgi:hypothetical protein
MLVSVLPGKPRIIWLWRSDQIAVFSPPSGLVAAATFLCAVGQLPDCMLSGRNNIPTPTTMMDTINMSCSVDGAVVMDDSEHYIWEWYRLAPDDISTIEERITDGITSSKNCIWRT